MLKSLPIGNFALSLLVAIGLILMLAASLGLRANAGEELPAQVGTSEEVSGPGAQVSAETLPFTTCGEGCAHGAH